jgi:hypothetical protein
MTNTAETTFVSEIPSDEVEELRCSLCGWVIEDPALATFTDTTAVHYDRTCPKGDTKPAPKARKAAVKPERKLAESAGIVAPVKRASGSHSDCEHAATKSARAACRKSRNA